MSLHQPSPITAPCNSLGGILPSWLPKGLLQTQNALFCHPTTSRGGRICILYRGLPFRRVFPLVYVAFVLRSVEGA